MDHYRKYLKSIDKTYDQIYRRDLGNTDLKDVFIQFYRVFQRKQILNPSTFFVEQCQQVGADNTVSSYEFSYIVGQTIPNINKERYKKLEEQLRDEYSGKISLNKFEQLYDSYRKKITPDELKTVGGNNLSRIEENRIYYMIHESL